MSAEARVATQTFPVERRSVRAARRFVVSALDEWNLLGLAHVALLLTSELATNALLHARTEFQVTARRRGDGSIRVEVLDGNTRVPSTTSIPLDATTGRGLKVVRALAESWGVDSNPQGKVVWFELSAPENG